MTNKKVFPKLTSIQKVAIKDTISDDPINTTLLKVLSGGRPIGYIRNISTTTGCNSACLPVNYTSFYDVKGNFLKLKSREGLTKLNHAVFTEEDYSQLELIISLSPKELSTIKNPKELTDAISGATLKQFQSLVVKGAAYSTLRIHLYNLETKSIINKLK